MARKSPSAGSPEASETPEARAFRFEPGEIENLLLTSEILGGELVPQGSNYTFAVKMGAADIQFWGIYKPASGERPLWDFPYGTLHLRERCAFLVSHHLGWHLVPPTVIREGPHGEGSVQLCVPYDGKSNYFTLRAETRPELLLLAAFDIMVNNTDRKGGHCFRAEDDRVWGIDHGLTFHAEPKLRTVIWDYAGFSLPEERVSDIRRLEDALRDGGSPLRNEMDALLAPEEVEVFLERVAAFRENPRLPTPEEYRRLHWPFE